MQCSVYWRQVVVDATVVVAVAILHILYNVYHYTNPRGNSTMIVLRLVVDGVAEEPRA